MARANRLKPAAAVGKAGLTEGVLAQLRTLLAQHDLVRVRLPRGEEAESLAREIAARVPCELVARTGFVATLCRAGEGAPESPHGEIGG
jgi:RNA-binding protein YhbY